MRWARHVARMGDTRNGYKILVGKAEGKNHLADLDVDGRTILEWILGKYRGKLWTWFDLAQDRDQWRNLANTVTVVWVPKKERGVFLTSWVLPSHEGLSSVGLVRPKYLSQAPALVALSLSASQSASQPASQSVSQSVSQSAGRPASQSASQPARQPASQPVSRPASQSASQSASQPASLALPVFQYFKYKVIL
jgi:hypothetical protein